MNPYAHIFQAIANDKSIQVASPTGWKPYSVDAFLTTFMEEDEDSSLLPPSDYRQEPDTITLPVNLPRPFSPKHGQECWTVHLGFFGCVWSDTSENDCYERAKEGGQVYETEELAKQALKAITNVMKAAK